MGHYQTRAWSLLDTVVEPGVVRNSEDAGDTADDVAELAGKDNCCIADDYCTYETLEEAVVVLVWVHCCCTCWERDGCRGTSRNRLHVVRTHYCRYLLVVEVNRQAALF